MLKIIRTATVPLSLDLLLEGQLKYLSQFHEVVAVSGSDHHLEKVAQREGVRTVPLAMERAINLKKDVIALIRLYFLFKKEKPQIVHSITPKAGLLSMIAARLAGVPIRIHTFTGLIFPYRTGMLHFILKQMDRITCAMATHIIPEGEGVKAQLQINKITNKTLQVLANGNVNGVNTAFFSPDAVLSSREELRELYSYNNTDFVFVFVGRLVVDKGIVELIDAFLNVSKLHSKVHLLLVGPFEPNLDPLPESTIHAIENDSRIIHVGFKEDIRPFLKMSDALILPSYREGFPNVVLQAGAMELPCVVTDIPGCNEVIETNINGLVVPLKDKKGLQLAMENLIKDPVFLDQLGQQARVKICAKYTNAIVWNALLEFYKKCIDEKRI